MSIIQIPDWLSNRPIGSDDIKELTLLPNEMGDFCFGDITTESLRKFYSYSPDAFYRLVRILGFYGAKFSGKLSPYNVPLEKYPEVLCVDKERWTGRIPINTALSLPFYSCGILRIKQLHGVPVKSVIALAGRNLSHEEITSSLPVTISLVHKGFFDSEIKPLFFEENELLGNNESHYRLEQPVSKTSVSTAENTSDVYSDQQLPIGNNHIAPLSVDTLNLSVRSLNCLRKAKIQTIPELSMKSDEELLSLPHFGLKSLLEIRIKLNSINSFKNQKLTPQSLLSRDAQEKIDLSSEESVKKLRLNLNDLVISARSKRFLKEKNIEFIWQLAQLKENELLEARNIGRKSINELLGILTDLGLQMGMKFPTEQIAKMGTCDDTFSEAIIKKLKTRVADLVLSVRSRRCLKIKNVEFIWQLAQLSENELGGIRNIGRKSVSELRNTLKKLGLRQGMKFTPEQLAKISAYEHTLEILSLNKSMKELVSALCGSPLAFLNEKENLIISERLFKAGRKQTLEGLAHLISLSRERVRQIEKTATQKIKQHHKEILRGIVTTVEQRVNQLGGMATLEELEIDKRAFSIKERSIFGGLLQMMNETFFVDWEFDILTTKGEEWVLALCNTIEEQIYTMVKDKFFNEQDLIEVTKQVLNNFGISSTQCQRNLIKRFHLEKKVTLLDNRFCCGRVTKQDQIVLIFKDFFPDGLEVYSKQDYLMQRLKESNPQRFSGASPRSVISRLVDHPDVFLWNRGFFIHKDHVPYDEKIIRDVVAWIIGRFEKGHSRFQIDSPFAIFKNNLQQGGISTPYALYTLLRLQENSRIGQRKYPTIVDKQADIDIREGILEELENYFVQAGGPIPYPKLKDDFHIKRGWKLYSLQQNIAAHSEVIYPWRDNSYIHIDYMTVDFSKLEEMIDALRTKLGVIQGAYSLKGAKKEMNVLWEQACPSASIRTMAKLIRSVGLEDLQIERYFVQLATHSTESVSAIAELEEFFLDKGVELHSYELKEEFCNNRGWSEIQFYNAIRKAFLFRSGKATYLHPTTIAWNESLSQEVHQAMEIHLAERNKNGYPHMQVEELIYQYALPELPLGTQWTRHLLKSVSQEFGDFLFFDDAYVAIDNKYDIEDLDDMIGFFIGRHFRLGIAKRVEVEQMLWREGVLESGKSIPADQFFDESSIVLLPDSDEVGLSPIGWERYGQSV